jgi:hypothetical protein
MKCNIFFKLFLCLYCIGYVTGTANAQFYAGGKFGLQLSTLHFADMEYHEQFKISPVPGLNLGCAMNLKITQSFDLYSEFIYSLKGSRIQSKDYMDINNRLTLSYFDIPLMLRTAVYKNPQYDFFFQMGPTIGFWGTGKGVMRTSELDEYNLDKAKYQLKWEETSGLISEVYVSEPNRVQLGLNLGFGSTYKFRNKHVFIVDIRYEMGHTYLSKSNEKIDYLGYGFDFKANNRAIIFSTAYLFNVQSLRKKLMK